MAVSLQHEEELSVVWAGEGARAAVVCLCSTRLSTNLGGVDGSPVACGKPTAEQADFVQRCSSIYLGNGVLWDHGVFCKGADPQEVVDLLPFASEPAGLVRQQVLRFRQTVERHKHLFIIR